MDTAAMKCALSPRAALPLQAKQDMSTSEMRTSGKGKAESLSFFLPLKNVLAYGHIVSVKQTTGGKRYETS
jgi:hypothetical protein